ncbi:MAG: 30S ribosomal protein S1 [Pyrinomonadaceae bacterium]
MSNEVINETEEAVESQDSVLEETQNQDAVEASKEENTGAVEAPQPEETAAAAETADESEADDAQNQGEMDFGAMLAQFEQEQVAYHVGETVSGKVVRVSDHGVLVDFGYKSEGAVALEEFTSPEGEIQVKKGDEVEVVIRSMGGDGPPNLSYFDAKSRRVWDDIERAFRDDEIVKGTITSKTKGGLKVDVQGVEAFLPGSQIDSRPVRNLDALKGEEIEAKVVKFSRKRNNIVLSRKVLTDEILNKQKAETLKDIQVGYIVDGTVKNLTEYGAFVDIGGIDGLLHVTDMSWGRLHKPSDMFKVGDTVQVKILKLDREKEKVSLGYKQLLPDPWSTVTELYPVESRIKGEISSVTEYGAFVELEPGVEGLVHVSEMSWAKRMKHPKHFVNKGDEVEVQVLGIDPEERRISLGIKQLQSNPWDTIGERYQLGSKVQGKVRNLTDFGAFVEIEDGVDGLVHVSDISWSKKVKHPKDVLKKGQEVEAVVTNIDTEGHRLSLSIKELTPSAWESYTNEHKPGDVVKGTISRFAGFGVFVELAPDLEGLCHISELSDERIENPESQFAVGQELDFKILRIEHDVEKIGLSARAVGKEDEPVIDTKSYSSDAKGGMASLGELANLKFGKQEDAPEEAKEESAEAAPEASAPESAEESNADAEAEKDAAEEVKAETAEEEPSSDETLETAPEVTAETEAKAEAGNSDAGEAETPEESSEAAAEAKTEEAAPETETAETETAETENADAAASPEGNAEVSAETEAEETADADDSSKGKKTKTKKADS